MSEMNGQIAMTAANTRALASLFCPALNQKLVAVCANHLDMDTAVMNKFDMSYASEYVMMTTLLLFLGWNKGRSDWIGFNSIDRASRTLEALASDMDAIAKDVLSDKVSDILDNYEGERDLAATTVDNTSVEAVEVVYTCAYMPVISFSHISYHRYLSPRSCACSSPVPSPRSATSSRAPRWSLSSWTFSGTLPTSWASFWCRDRGRVIILTIAIIMTVVVAATPTLTIALR